MLTEDGKHLYVSYDEYHNLIEKLALKIHQSGWQFDTILCLARGGMRPGDILSRIFDKPLAIMSTSSYRADGGTVQRHLDIARLQKSQIDLRDGGQPAGRQDAVGAALQRGEAFFQRERGRRAMQAIGVGRLVHPLPLAHGGDAGKKNGRGLVDPDLRCLELARGTVCVVDQIGAAGHARILPTAPRRGPQSFHFSISWAGRMVSYGSNGW